MIHGMLLIKRPFYRKNKRIKNFWLVGVYLSGSFISTPRMCMVLIMLLLKQLFQHDYLRFDFCKFIDSILSKLILFKSNRKHGGGGST